MYELRLYNQIMKRVSRSYILTINILIVIIETKRLEPIYMLNDAQLFAGKPVMRPLFLDFEEDYPGSYNNDYQYMFGDDILVAPVTEPRVAEWTVYLPGKSIRNITDFQILLKSY